MSTPRSEMRSAYMEWAKLHARATYNLATSGVANFPLDKLPVRLEDLELTGPVGYGYAPLRRRLGARYGVNAECVVAATGTSMANHLAMAAAFDPGDEVLIEHPTYELLVETAAYLGAEIKRFLRRPENEFRMEPAEIERAMTPRTRLIVLTNLHNPSGVLTEESVLEQVGEIARGANARVLVDEVYLDAAFARGPRSAVHLGKHFLATSSLTKVYGLSGLRCGWILAAPEMAERMWRLNDLYGVNAAHPAERLSVVALDHLDAIAARAKALIETNRALLRGFLDSRSEIRTVWPEAGALAFPRLRGDAEALYTRLREEFNTSVAPGRFFGLPAHFRIGVGGETAMVEEGLKRIGAALDKLT